MPPMGIIAHNGMRHKCHIVATFLGIFTLCFHVFYCILQILNFLCLFLQFYIDLLRRAAYNDRCQEELIPMAINKPEETKNEVR